MREPSTIARLSPGYASLASTTVERHGNKMLYMKACPRCKGDVHMNRDSFGAYAKCLQCGFNRDFPNKRSGIPTDATAAGDAGLPAPDEKREAA